MVGSDEYLTKPFTKDSLLKTIGRTRPFALEEIAMAVKKILIVDDSPTDRQFFMETLSKHGYQVVTAENGDEAIIKSKSEKPDLI